MNVALHHGALCVRDLDTSLRFYRDGIGLSALMDEEFEGDWPTLFGTSSRRLRSIFLGDPRRPDAGLVELVSFVGAALGEDRAPRSATPPAVASATASATPRATPPGSAGFFLLSFFVDVNATLARLRSLGFDDVRRIEQPAPGGAVTMATVRDPDAVLVELVDTSTGRQAAG